MDIFVDVVAAVTKKTVNKRTKMLHVNAEKKHVLSGDRCGVYMNKYIELYSTIVLQQIKMWNAYIVNELRKALMSYSREYSKLQII